MVRPRLGGVLYIYNYTSTGIRSNVFTCNNCKEGTRHFVEARVLFAKDAMVSEVTTILTTQRLGL